MLDLFSRRVIGWSMQLRITKELTRDAFLIAVWRRQPAGKIIVHSDQGSQYTCRDWNSLPKGHGREGSMSRLENCHDSDVAESFFQLLKRERIKRKLYSIGRQPEQISSIISRCFAVDTILKRICRQ